MGLCILYGSRAKDMIFYVVLWALWVDYVYFTEKLCMRYVILWAVYGFM